MIDECDDQCLLATVMIIFIKPLALIRQGLLH